MKKLLFILIFYTCTAKAQIVITTLINLNASTADGTSVNGTITTTNGRFYIGVVGSSKATTPDIPTLTKTAGLTFTQLATQTTATHRITVFYGLCTATDANTLSASFGGNTQTGTIIGLYEITGNVQTGTNGVGAIVQSTGNTTTGVDPSLTLSAISSGQNAVMAFFINDLNPFGGTPEASWTSGSNSGYNTPSTGIFEIERLTTTDNTPSMTASSSAWAGVAVEIKSLLATRRRIIID